MKNISWNLRKPIKKNIIETGLHFISPAGFFLEPWQSDVLDKYLQYDIMNAKKFLSLFVDDDNICPFNNPLNPTAVYLQTPLLNNETTLNTTIELTESIPVKVLSVRNKADILNEDILSINYEANYLTVIHDGLNKGCVEITIDEPINLSVEVRQNEISVSMNDYKLNINETIENDYWINFGLVNTPIKTYNNIRIEKIEFI